MVQLHYEHRESDFIEETMYLHSSKMGILRVPPDKRKSYSFAINFGTSGLEVEIYCGSTKLNEFLLNRKGNAGKSM